MDKYRVLDMSFCEPDENGITIGYVIVAERGSVDAIPINIVVTKDGEIFKRC